MTVNMSLPTYEEITSISTPKYAKAIYLTVVHCDLNGATLASLSRVSRTCNSLVNPVLWADPFEIIKKKSKPFTEAHTFLCRFWSNREQTRNLVTNLDSSKLLSVINDDHEDWNINEMRITGQRLFSVLHQYRNLQFIILDGLRYFAGIYSENSDQLQSLRAINEAAKLSNDELDLPEPLVFSALACKELDCMDALTCPSMSSLLFLDVSYTQRVVSWSSFVDLNLTSLRILKLRGLQLTDKDLQNILIGVPKTLWSLDIRENLLTDLIMNRLGNHFLGRIPHHKEIYHKHYANRFHDDAPAYTPVESTQVTTAPFRIDSSDAVINHIKFHGRLSNSCGLTFDYEDPFLRITGLTHLYLANNKISSWGITRLLEATNRLQLLNAGSVPMSHASCLVPQALFLRQPDTINHLNAGHNGTRLEQLRIHHSVITDIPTRVIPGSKKFSLEHLKIVEDAGSNAKLLAKLKTPQDKLNSEELSLLRSNYRLNHLTLTGIPSKTYGFIAQELIAFLEEAYIQEQTLRTIAHSTSSHNRHIPPLLCGLRTLVLEFLPPDIKPHQDANAVLTKFVKEFSFFDEPANDSPTSGSTTKDFSFFESTFDTAPRPVESPKTSHSSIFDSSPKRFDDGLLDVVDELKKFRGKDQGRRWTGELKCVFPYGR